MKGTFKLHQLKPTRCKYTFYENKSMSSVKVR